eukprot:2366867-Rhodomonas_salina.1
MGGTELGYGATDKRGIASTSAGYAALSAYAICLRYLPMLSAYTRAIPCPVLTSRMVLRDAEYCASCTMLWPTRMTYAYDLRVWPTHNVRTDNVRADNVRADNVRADNVRADNVQGVFGCVTASPSLALRARGLNLKPLRGSPLPPPTLSSSAILYAISLCYLPTLSPYASTLRYRLQGPCLTPSCAVVLRGVSTKLGVRCYGTGVASYGMEVGGLR